MDPLTLFGTLLLGNLVIVGLLSWLARPRKSYADSC